MHLGDGGRTVEFQWTDAVGELHCWALNPDQSSAYLAPAQAD